MQCVILGAGRGTRLGASGPKPLIHVAGRPALAHIMDTWRDCVDGFVIISDKTHEQDYSRYLHGRESLPYQVVVQEPVIGIAHAIRQAEPWVDDRFVVALGDCLYQGEFLIPEKPEPIRQGVGVWMQASPSDIQAGYGVAVSNDGILTDAEEKPKDPTGYLCGMGVYFFDASVFAYLAAAKVTPLRNELEITNVLHKMIHEGEGLSAVRFNGWYVNINIASDLRRAEALL